MVTTDRKLAAVADRNPYLRSHPHHWPDSLRLALGEQVADRLGASDAGRGRAAADEFPGGPASASASAGSPSNGSPGVSTIVPA
jgi:hypothetical protein